MTWYSDVKWFSSKTCSRNIPFRQHPGRNTPLALFPSFAPPIGTWSHCLWSGYWLPQPGTTTMEPIELHLAGEKHGLLTYGCFQKFWVKTPQIIHFNRVFHDFHHPFWGTPIFGNTHTPNYNLIPNGHAMITHSIHVWYIHLHLA